MNGKLKFAVLFALIAVLAMGTGALAAKGDLLISADTGPIITSADGKMIADYTSAVHLKKGEIGISLKPGARFEAPAGDLGWFYWVLKLDAKIYHLYEVVASKDGWGGWSPLVTATKIHVTSSDGALFDSSLFPPGADHFHSFWVAPKGNQSFWITLTPEVETDVKLISFDNASHSPADTLNTSKDMAITFKFTVEVPAKPLTPEERKELIKDTKIKIDDTGRVDLNSVISTGTSFDKANAVAIPMFQAAVTPNVGGVVGGVAVDLSAKMPEATPANFDAGDATQIILYKVLASGKLQALDKVSSPSREGQYSVSGTASDMKFDIWIHSCPK